MNKFDERYYIRLAKYEDIESIMSFLKQNWSKDHIVANDRKLFEYEYVDNKDVNFIIAIDKKSNEIEAVFGFIKSSQNEEKTDVWGSIWKVNSANNNIHFLGVELINRLKDKLNYRYRLGIGANPKTSVVINKKIFKRETRKMNHHYILNDSFSSFKLAEIKKIYDADIKSIWRTQVKKYDNFNNLTREFNFEKIDQIPFKDNQYIQKRYFNHPYYEYNIYGVFEQKEIVEAILITREVCHGGYKALRIVDYIGNHKMITGLREVFKDMLIINDYEYIDLYSYGFKDAYLRDAGFIKRTVDDRNIIPNYYEPFVQKNIDIWVHYDKANVMFFKGDGDQDRPNQLRN